MGAQLLRPWGLDKPPIGWQLRTDYAEDFGLVSLLAEGAGGRVFDLAKNQVGVLTGGFAWASSCRGGHSPVGQAIQLNGTTGLINYGTLASAQPTAKMTLRAWVSLNANSGAGGNVFLGWDNFDTGRNGVAIYTARPGSANVLATEVASGSAFQDTAGTGDFTPNVWYCVTVTLDGSNIREYINGLISRTTAQTITPTAGTYPIVAGQNASTADGSYWLNGLVDCLVISKRAWSPEEVMQDYLNPFWMMQAPRRIAVSTTGIAFDAASNSGYQAADNDYTFNRTVGTGTNRFLRVEVEILGAPGTTVTAVTDDNAGTPVPMVYIGTGSSATGIGIVDFWGLANPVSGTKEIRVQLSGSVASAAVAASYANVHQTSPYANFTSAQATNVGAADASVTITSDATGSWVVAAIASDDASITAGQTTRNNVTGAGGSGADEDTNGIVSPGTTAMTYTGVAALATWVIGGYELRPDTASTLGGNHNNLLLLGVG